MSDVEVTTSFIINHAQEKFDSVKGITEELRTMRGLSTYEWRPIMSASTSDDEAVCDRENREFELD